MLHSIANLFRRASAVNRSTKSHRKKRSYPLWIDQLEDRVTPATFSFAGFTFEQESTPTIATVLQPGTVPDGFGATITNVPVARSSSVGFPNDPTTGFDTELSIGELIIGGGSGATAVNLPGGNDGVANRSGIQLAFSGNQTLENVTGDDFVVYESASNSTAAEGYMVQVHNASTNTWSAWRYEPVEAFENYTGEPTEGGMATSFDLSDFGIAIGETADAFRIANMTDEDRMVDSSGVGEVIPEDDGDTSSFFPDPGTFGPTNFGTGTLDPDPLYLGVFNALETTPNPDLSIAKSSGGDGVIAGQNVTYVITVINNSTILVTGAEVADTFPVDLQDVTYTSFAGGGATGNTELEVGASEISDTLTMPAGSFVTYTVTGTVDINATGTLSNTATVTPPSGVTDPNTANNSSTDNDTITDAPDLAITKDDGLTDVQAGDMVTYTITVSVTGDVTGATVTDNFPGSLQGVTFTSVASGGATGNTAAGTGNINDVVNMPDGSTITYTVTGTVPVGAAGVLSNTATVTAPSSQPDGNTSNNAATDTTNIIPNPDLFITKSNGVNTVIAGLPTTYTITVSNIGAGDAVGATLTDLIPVELEDVTFTSTASGGATGNTAAGAGALNELLDLPAGSSVTYIITARVSGQASGLLVNTATATAPLATPDVDPGNNSATDTDTIVPVTPLIAVGSGPGQEPLVNVYDADGAFVRQIDAYGAFTGGVQVATGDVNRDGFDDVITGAGPGGGPHVKVFDGQTGAEIRSFFAFGGTFDGGVFVAAGDVNDDGFADIIAGAGAGGGPRVQVFDGQTGALIRDFFAFEQTFPGGVTVAAGDIDDDGFADIITGAGAGGGPRVRVFSGTNLSGLADFFAYETTFSGGVFVSSGDVNSDGVADIITGAGAGGGPRVRVFDGSNPAVALRDFFAFEDSFSGGVRVGSVDRANDGVDDILAGRGPSGTDPIPLNNFGGFLPGTPTSGPEVRSFNGETLAEIDTFFAFDPLFDGGVHVS